MKLIENTTDDLINDISHDKHLLYDLDTIKKCDTPLIYDDTLNTTNIINVLLIDSNVQDYNSFVTNSNTNTFPIVYSYNSNRDDLFKLLESKFTSIERIGIVTHDAGISNGKEFLNNQLLFTDNDLTSDCVEYSDNLNFIIDVIKKFGVNNYDYLACNTLKYSNWNSYYNLLSSKTGVIVGASNDATGNIKYGGDWVMESTGQDIEYIYFTSGIENYASVLATTITGTVTITQALIDSYTFPVTINAGSTVTLGENITLSGGTSNYFIIGGNGVTFNGAGFNVTISNITSYPGLISNGGFSCFIKNVGVLSSGTTFLASNAGWLCQSNFSTASGTITVTDCYSTGVISGFGSGGIFGSNANRSSSGTITVTDCYSTGIISGPDSGGIFGSYANQSSSGTITVTECYSTGVISGFGSGGIFGSYANQSSSGTITVTGCYSSGIISGPDSGGIFGIFANRSSSGTITVTDCYSTGAISGSDSGGIFGAAANYESLSSGTITVTECYSTGAISGSYSGEIFGIFANRSSSGTITVTDCYSTGAISGSDSGGIFGGYANQSSSGTITVTGCYSAGDISRDGSGGIFGSYANYQSLSSGTITVTDCYSTGAISGPASGGIFGSYANQSPSGTITVTDCYSTGAISGSDSGGIFGSYANYQSLSSGTITVTECYSTGAIFGPYSGGIFGSYANQSSSGTITVTECYSTGVISGFGSGGIFGGYANQSSSGTITVTGCYSAGDISRDGSGGIFGSNANQSSSGTITITDCYSAGAISGPASGGIFGSNANQSSSGTITVTDCYSAGAISGTNSGGIFGFNQSGTITTTNTYSANGTWSNGTASSNGITTGSIWNNVSNLTTIPYTLTNGFNTPSYNTLNYYTYSFSILLASGYIYFIIVPPKNGTATFSGNTLNYSQITNIPDTFTYQVNNGINYYSLITVNVFPPTVTSVSPVAGPLAGNQFVTITGTNFIGASSVTFAGTTATNLNVVSSTSITCITPSGTAGTASVLVTTPGGTNPANILYAYQEAPTVTSVSPVAGPLAGNQFVTITGTNFIGASSVTFAGTTATNLNVVSSTSITCTTPSGTAGSASVLVTTPIGTNPANILYAYQEAPTTENISVITSFNTLIQITLVGSDIYNNSLTYQIISNPTNGLLSTITNNLVTYTPFNSYTGTDSFTYQCTDNYDNISNISTVFISVLNANTGSTSVTYPPVSTPNTTTQITNVSSTSQSIQTSNLPIGSSLSAASTYSTQSSTLYLSLNYTDSSDNIITNAPPNSSPDYYTIYTTNQPIINLVTTKNTGQQIILISNGIIQNSNYISGPVINNSKYNYTIKQYCTFNIKTGNLGIKNNCNPKIKDLFFTTQQNKFIFIKLLPISSHYSYKIIQEPKHGKLIKYKNGDYIYEPIKNYIGKDLLKYQYYIKNTCVISNVANVVIEIK